MSISIENNVKHFSQLLDKTSSYIHAIFGPASPPIPPSFDLDSSSYFIRRRLDVF